MSEMPKLFRRLDDQWGRDGRSAAARAALVRWAESTPRLAVAADPADLVRRCHDRDAAASEIVGGVLAEAGRDCWAIRTVLQAVLPGLATVARRADGYVGGPRPVWQSRDELHQDVLCVALERIRVLSTAPPPFPCRAIIDGTWQRLRYHATSVRSGLDRRADLDAGADVVAASERTWLEELGLAVIDAVESRSLDILDAGLVYSCHVAGYRVSELAATTGRSARTLWRRRRRAEDVLAASGCASGGPRSSVGSVVHGRGGGLVSLPSRRLVSRPMGCDAVGRDDD